MERKLFQNPDLDELEMAAEGLKDFTVENLVKIVATGSIEGLSPSKFGDYLESKAGKKDTLIILKRINKWLDSDSRKGEASRQLNQLANRLNSGLNRIIF